MLSVIQLPALRKLGDRYKDLAAEVGIGFSSLIGYLALFLFGCESFSEFIRSNGWSLSLSSFSRNAAKFKPNRFMRRLRSSILRKAHKHGDAKNFCFAVDDTNNPKYGPNIYGRGHFGGSQGLYWGQKILLLVLVDIKAKRAYPLQYYFCHNKHEAQYKSAIELAIEGFTTLKAEGWPQLPVVTDSWFDGNQFRSGLKSLAFDLVTEIKNNRLVRQNPGQRVQWQGIKRFFKHHMRRRLSRKYIAGEKLFLKRSASILNIIAVSNTLNGEPFAYYASTDLSMSWARIWLLSRARWAIEVMFMDLKQNLGFGKLSCTNQGAAHMAVCLPLLIYADLLLYPEDYKVQVSLTIGKKLTIIRREHFIRNVERVHQERGLIQPFERFKCRNHHSRAQKKPVNRLAEIQMIKNIA